MPFTGRHEILTTESEITRENVVGVLQTALATHVINRAEIHYLWKYYRGDQPIRYRTKHVRDDIINIVEENRAYEIVTFKTGYLMGEPVEYVCRSGAESKSEEVTTLNEYAVSEEKASRDSELAEWMHVCGVGYRMVLPDPAAGTEDEEDSPFEIYTLDPREAFVVRHNGLGKKPVLGVKFVKDSYGDVHFSCYTKDRYFEIVNDGIVIDAPHSLGDIPIVEYPLNLPRLGSFEVVLSLLDAINTTESNRVDGVEQFIQALIETQCLVDHMYKAVLTIVGMPNRNGSSSTSDTGLAVVYRDGWSAAESVAKLSENMFKKSERRFLRLLLRICRDLGSLPTLKVSDIKIQFTRRNYENIQMKAQVLDLMLKNPSIHPRLAFEHCGMFPDPDLAYKLSMEWAKEQERKAQEQMKQQILLKQGGSDGGQSNTDTGNGGGDRKTAQARKQG